MVPLLRPKQCATEDSKSQPRCERDYWKTRKVLMVSRTSIQILSNNSTFWILETGKILWLLLCDLGTLDARRWCLLLFTAVFQFCCATFFITVFTRSSSTSFFLSPDEKCKWTSTSRDVDFSQRLELMSMTRSSHSSATPSQCCCAFPNKSGRFTPRFSPVSFDAFSLSAFLLFSLLKPGLDFEHLLNFSVSSFSSTALSWKFWWRTFKLCSTKMKLDAVFLILSAISRKHGKINSWHR